MIPRSKPTLSRAPATRGHLAASSLSTARSPAAKESRADLPARFLSRSRRGARRRDEAATDRQLREGVEIGVSRGGLSRTTAPRPAAHGHPKFRAAWRPGARRDAAHPAQDAQRLRAVQHRQRGRPARCGATARRDVNSADAPWLTCQLFSSSNHLEGPRGCA
jgi:hypothetical protein